MTDETQPQFTPGEKVWYCQGVARWLAVVVKQTMQAPYFWCEITMCSSDTRPHIVSPKTLEKIA